MSDANDCRTLPRPSPQNSSLEQAAIRSHRCPTSANPVSMPFPLRPWQGLAYLRGCPDAVASVKRGPPNRW
ncbi:hypothetical protein BDY21DRAFT_335123 [Lineolata rhizophorae]|uniref:Uncharacterized protein n=1 Tax=Lineolata rhizophorae TaxID=578093 RepID=A0A6A6P8M5_9PEZI|nr:hypothetical protein BDY21DRAFT_335123 [Lineolata rhizophorae]